MYLYQNGSKSSEFRALLDEAEIDYKLFEKQSACSYCNSTETVFVEGKVFRCPKTAEAYANGKETDETLFTDIVARKLEIKALRLALFDFTNSAPCESCEACERNNR
ncbi:MAG TPA: hypothetical protein DDY98_03950 [Ruminococcaceae bacterium]|nr:hypothetical protein [Oscillospiraceae bacterium]